MTYCLQHYIRPKKQKFAVNKHSSLKYKYKYLDLVHEYNLSTSAKYYSSTAHGLVNECST